jgi:hypothetical protein
MIAVFRQTAWTPLVSGFCRHSTKCRTCSYVSSFGLSMPCLSRKTWMDGAPRRLVAALGGGLVGVADAEQFRQPKLPPALVVGALVLQFLDGQLGAQFMGLAGVGGDLVRQAGALLAPLAAPVVLNPPVLAAVTLEELRQAHGQRGGEGLEK